MMKVALLFTACAILLVGVAAWGIEGHQACASVAMGLLTPEAQAGLKALLGSQTLVDVADWADQIKSNPDYKWASPLHYADIVDWSCVFDMSDCPNNICVVGAINNYTNILSSGSDQGQLTIAAKFLTHFFGDVHQPLHVGFAGDLGGNDIDVTFDGDDWNLHATWDSAIIQDRLGDYNNDTLTWAAALAKSLPANTTAWTTCPGSDPSVVVCPEHWANESAKLACTHAYVEGDGTTHITDSDDLGGQGDAYYNRNLIVIESQIQKAGVRMAAMFNANFAQKGATVSHDLREVLQSLRIR